jgi:hypothetical protein
MTIPVWQRLLGVLVYVLPWSDAIPFGGHLMGQFPWLQWLTLPALPLVLLERGIPFGNLLVFFVLFLAVARNPNVPYFLRFNTLQAILIDIVVVLLGYGFQLLIAPLGNGLILHTLGSTVLLAVLAIVIFALIECLGGREPDLPGISQAVRMQLY